MFKYIARNFELTSLQEVQDRLEESMKNENPINRETQIMEHYVNLIELIHKYKLIREDLGFTGNYYIEIFCSSSLSKGVEGFVTFSPPKTN
mgnify:CR=1 FL=1